MYGTLDAETDFISFIQKVSVLTLLENQFMYVKVRATCAAEFNIVAGGVHDLVQS